MVAKAAESNPYVLWLDIKGQGFFKANAGLTDLPATYDTYADCYLTGIYLLIKYSDIMRIACYLVGIEP